MCGIALLVDREMERAHLERYGVAAVAALAHRGPDGSNIQLGAGWVMAHTRLAIVDPAGSKQPMATPDGRHWLTFNGEIHNYQELRKLLASRWSFRTNGDTEVLLAGLMLDGPGFLNQANGMWAFALWDAREQRLLLARDRLGEKPLYFRQMGRALACASELPALRSLAPDSPWIEDVDSTSDYLRYGFALPGYTAWRDVREVLPGHWLEWTPGRDVLQTRYWSINDNPFRGNRRDAVVATRELLSDAVRLRMVADVDVGCFLSGGVDSSLIATLATQVAGRRMHTFSIGFADPSYDESWAARRVADSIGSIHASETITAMRHPELRNALEASVGQPFADASLLPTSILSRLAATQVKVALSGDGGDELFAGYQRYVGRALLRWYTRLPSSLRRSAERILRTFPEPIAHHSRSLLKKAHLFMDSANALDDGVSSYVAPRIFSDTQLRLVAPDLFERGHQPPALPQQCGIDDIQQMMSADALSYLPQDILVKVDRASMAHSLEVRSPFLDHRLVELALTVGSSMHLHRFRGKRLLRRATGSLAPGWVWQRRKQGFAVPTGAWFRGALGDELGCMLRMDGLPVQPAVVRGMLDAHRAGLRDHGLRLWALWSYINWRSGRSGRSTH